MIAWLKKWGIRVLFALCIMLLCGVAGYIIRWKQSPTITVSQQGAIIERTNIIYKPISMGADSPCADIASRYNSLLADHTFFINAVPEVYEVTSAKILFKLATQKYSLSYNYTEKARWSITPFATIRFALSPMAIYYGGGVSWEYYNITAHISVDNHPSLTAAIGYRILIP